MNDERQVPQGESRRVPTGALKRAAFALTMPVLVLVAAPAGAQTSSPPVPGTVVPPRLKTDSPATYPEQALKDGVTTAVTVTLILDIDAAGTVSKATVESPVGHGFDEAAIAAAQKLMFEPATRAGVPIAARIKFQYVFKPPLPRLVGRVADQDTDRAIPGATVVVRAADGSERRPVVDADGTWSVDDLPAGPIHLTISMSGYVPVEADEKLTAGEETSLVVRLERVKPPPPPPAAGNGGEQALEVTVRGRRPPREVTRRTLTEDEIAHIPGTNGDALRSILSLPGVARPPPFSGQLIVRGSAPQDTTIFVDGVDVPFVYHFGGLSSVLPTELLDKIDFYPSNYSAVYGRGMGGMVDVRLRNPKGDKLHGMAEVDFIDARVLAEGPIFDTGWKFLVAGRRSYFDLWIGPVLRSAGAPATTAPRYYDYQAMLQKDIDRRSSFRLVFYGSNDALELLNPTPSASDPTFGGDFRGHSSFWRLQALYENKLTDATRLTFNAAIGQDSIDFGIGPDFLNLSQMPLSGRLELTQKIARGVQANIGVDFFYAPYNLTLHFPPPRRPGVAPGGPLDQPQESHQKGSRTMPAFYTEWELVPLVRTRIVAGLRADYSNAIDAWDISPRINIRQDLTSGFPQTTLKAGVGLFYQPPSPFDTDPFIGQKGLKSSRAVQYDVGLEQDFTQHIKLSTDVFYKALDRLVVEGAGNAGKGAAYGIECLLKYQASERFFGWLAYTLSRSERRDLPSDPMRLSQYDQTHILTVLGSYKLGRGWRLGGRFQFVSGNLYTPTTEGAYDATASAYQGAPAYPPFGARLPPFHQLDVRVDKTWAFNAWKLTLYADIQNVYFHQSPEGVSYNYNFTQSSYVNGLPILPSLGLRGEF